MTVPQDLASVAEALDRNARVCRMVLATLDMPTLTTTTAWAGSASASISPAW